MGKTPREETAATRYTWVLSSAMLVLVLVLVPVSVLVLKHKDSSGKSENLSKIFFAEILVFDHDYEGKSSSSNGLL